MKIIVAGNLVIRLPSVKRRVHAECEPVVGVDISYQVKALKPILIRSAPLGVRMVLVLGKGIDAAGIALESRQGVLRLAAKPSPRPAAKGEVKRVL